MECDARNVARRRYMGRFWPAMSLYVVLLLGITFLLKHVPVSGALLYGLAVLPALPLLAVIAVMGMYLAEESDEFARVVQVQSILWAVGGVLGLTTVWGFLEMFAPVAHLQPFWLFPLFCMLMGLAQPLVRLKYR